MKRVALFLFLVLIVLMSARQAFAVHSLDRATPNEGPPGSIIRLEGTDILRDYRFRDMKVVIAFHRPESDYWPEGPDTFFMETQVINWLYDFVEVRLPGLDERAYVRALGDAPTTLSNSIKEYLNIHRVPGLAYIIGIRPDGTIENFTNSVSFFLTPSPAEPVLNRLSRATVSEGEGIALYGSGFGSMMGEIIFQKDGSGSPLVPASWASTYATTTVRGLEPGAYEVYVRSDGGVSNRKWVTVAPAAGSAGGVVTMDTAGRSIGPVTPSMPANPYCAAYYATLSPPIPGPETCTVFFWTNRGQIAGQSVNSGPPGSFVEMNGRCLGDSPAGRKIYMQSSAMFEPIELEPLLWSKQKIIVRIPGPERIITTTGGEEVIAKFPDGRPDLIYDLSGGPVSVRISISGIESDSNSIDFRIEPYAADRVPSICYSTPADVIAGDCFKVFGVGLGDGGDSQLFYYKEGVSPVGATVKLWTSTQVSACTLPDATTGTNELIISKYSPEGHLASNKVYINVLPRIGAAMPTLEPLKKRPSELGVVERPQIEVRPSTTRDVDIESAGPQQSLSPLLNNKKKEPAGDSSNLPTGTSGSDSTIDKKKK